MSTIKITKRVLQPREVPVDSGELYELVLKDDFGNTQLALNVVEVSKDVRVFSISSSTNKIILVNADGSVVPDGVGETTTPDPDGGQEQPPIVPPITSSTYEGSVLIIPAETRFKTLSAEVLKYNSVSKTDEVLGTIDLDLPEEKTLAQLMTAYREELLLNDVSEPVFHLGEDGTLSGIKVVSDATDSSVTETYKDGSGVEHTWVPTDFGATYKNDVYTLKVKATQVVDALPELDFYTAVVAAGITDGKVLTGVAKLNNAL